MFDRTIEQQHIHHHEAPKGPKIVNETRTIHEHRAPTDESVKLLAEFEAKARERIAQTVRVQGAWLDCVVMVEMAHASYEVVLRAVFAVERPIHPDDKPNIEVEHRFRTQRALAGLGGTTPVPVTEIDRLKEKVAAKIVEIMINEAWLTLKHPVKFG